jgi:hypothetical protein
MNARSSVEGSASTISRTSDQIILKKCDQIILEMTGVEQGGRAEGPRSGPPERVVHAFSMPEAKPRNPGDRDRPPRASPGGVSSSSPTSTRAKKLTPPIQARSQSRLSRGYVVSVAPSAARP